MHMEAFAQGFVPGVPRIAYREAGRGAPVIFMHGIGGNSRNWAEQMPAVADHFHAIAWDARGYGDSEDYEGELRFPTFGHDLSRLLDHLEVPAAHLVGLSMGGRIALDFYEQSPSRVLSLSLVDTFAGYDDSFTPAAREKFIELRRKPLLEGKEPRDIAPVVAQTLVSSRASPAHIAALIDSMSRLHKFSYIKTIEAMTRYERVADLSKVHVPTLVVVGDQDRLTPPSVAREMTTAIAGAELAIIRNAGHLANIEQPALFNAILLDFLLRL
jgi:3-oxoadipate enol-lactonase